MLRLMLLMVLLCCRLWAGWCFNETIVLHRGAPASQINSVGNRKNLPSEPPLVG